MRLGNIKFRDYDRKWIFFDKKKDINKIERKLKVEFDDGIVLGYVYISHEDGMQIKILGNIIIEENEYSIDKDFIYKNTSIPFSTKLKYKITEVNEDIIKNIEYYDQVVSHYDSFYTRKSILESRKIKEIDEFRNETYIDDVELTLNTNKKQEYLWARIEDCSPDNSVFVCTLLNKSRNNKSYKKDTPVFAKIVKDKKNIDFVIDGIAHKVEKKEN